MKIKSTGGATCRNCGETYHKPIDIDVHPDGVTYQFKCEGCGWINSAAPDSSTLDYEAFEPFEPEEDNNDTS